VEFFFLHTKFLGLVEFLGENTPFPPALLRNFKFLGEFFCTYEILNFNCYLFVLLLMAEEQKDGDDLDIADTVGPAANYAIAKNFFNFEGLGPIDACL
jgi:hypothetical protein